MMLGRGNKWINIGSWGFFDITGVSLGLDSNLLSAWMAKEGMRCFQLYLIANKIACLRAR